MEIDDLDKLLIYESREIVSLMVLNGNICTMNSSGIVTKLETQEKLLECSPLLNPIISSYIIENRIHVVSNKSISSFTPDSPLDYESYETEKMSFRNPSHQLCFGPSEYTVDVACDKSSLYSLTAAGVVSVWKLRPNGLELVIFNHIWEFFRRKYRDQLFTTYLNHCTRLLLTYPQKFVILTASEVHFVVFGTDSDTNGPSTRQP
ncbi:hypothetical protein GCK72_003824 [Caenorhabditis remanei]|uniref:Uncharacterized protein n=1 Tax=Caenorhabditis remanei TaxID=31234 RepID=A0A6A5H810_CAERE|nr:hypothetical protein GCK72_003824 [Caenorhabditis remanei]KAF1763878.1 hypothetical protein GCK72_003824 [Caenorhabditis remanei]